MQILKVDSSKIVRGPKGLRLEAKAAYREGQAMLTVYGFWVDTVTTRRELSHRVVLQRVFVPTTRTKAEKHNMLRAMCDLLAVQYGEAYYLRSKLQ
jgi:hypothetical protein